jgi:hypothetical protein
MLSSSSVPRKLERTATRVIGGEAVIMVIDRREIHRLNGVGTRVFELCDGRSSIEAIARAIVDEFEVDQEHALSDVLRFVTELAEVGALVVADAELPAVGALVVEKAS